MLRNVALMRLALAGVVACVCGPTCLPPEAADSDAPAVLDPGQDDPDANRGIAPGDPGATGTDTGAAAVAPCLGTSDSTTFRPAGLADGPVGRLASIDIALKQGAEVLLTTTVTLDPNDPLSTSDPVHYQIVPEYHYHDDGGRSNTAVYLHVWMDTPEQYLSNIGLALRAGKQAGFWKQGNAPLLRLGEGEGIILTICNARFTHQGVLQPVLMGHYPNPDTLASAVYMLHYGENASSYYRLPEALLYGNTLQVPQSAFTDGDDDYWFQEGSGWTPGATWEINAKPPYEPGRGYVVRTVEGFDGFQNGDVFELGVSAFVWRMVEVTP